MKQTFIDIISKADKKVLIPTFDNAYRVELLRFENFYSIHQYTQPSRFNIGGRHYHYIHGMDGNFQHSVNGITGRPLEKIKLYKKDLEELGKYRKIPENNS